MRTPRRAMLPVAAPGSWSMTANPMDVVPMSKPKIRSAMIPPLQSPGGTHTICGVADREAVGSLFVANRPPRAGSASQGSSAGLDPRRKTGSSHWGRRSFAMRAAARAPRLRCRVRSQDRRTWLEKAPPLPCARAIRGVPCWRSPASPCSLAHRLDEREHAVDAGMAARQAAAAGRRDALDKRGRIR